MTAPLPRHGRRFGAPLRKAGPLAAMLALLATLACSGDGDGPTPPDDGPDVGLMEVVVATGPSDTGVLLIEITGRVDGPATLVGEGEVWQHAAATARTVVLVRGPSVPGPVLRFQSPDRRASYAVRVLDAAAAAAGGYATLDSGDFAVSIQPLD